MPKIFLIKNRLHQQQLRLLESQNAAATKNELATSGTGGGTGSVLGDNTQQPLSLIVHKKDGKDNS